MSTGTNRERLEQNNTLLEDIKTQIQKLPEASGSGDVKLFETEEEMQADTTAKEGDLAIIYRSEVQNATADSKFQIANFPDTVVLNTAITDYVDVRYRAVDSSKMFDCMGSLDSSMFMMDCYTESGSIRIQYTSSDGITYTRTDNTGNPVDFGTEIYYERAEYWDDAIGKFIQVGGKMFEGLYEYTSNTDNEVSTLGQRLSNMYPTYTKDVLYHKTSEINQLSLYYDTMDDFLCRLYIKFDVNPENYLGNEIFHQIEAYASPDTESSFGNVYNGAMTLIIEDDIPYIGIVSNTLKDFTIYHYENNAMNTEIIHSSELNTFIRNNSTNYYYKIKQINLSEWVCNYISSYFNIATSGTSQPYFLTITNGSFGSYHPSGDLSCTPLHLTTTRYYYAPTQLTAIPDYVYEKEFYGQNGVETGTLQNKENLTKDEVKRRVDMWSSYNSGIVCPSNSSDMFYNCTNLTAIPLLDTNSVTNMSNMFYNCTNLTTIPLLDTSSVTNMSAMFAGCKSLTAIPLLDTSSVTNMSSIFERCTSLTTIPLLNTSKVTRLYAVFNGCSSLTAVPQLDTSNVTSMANTFAGCTSLTTIPLLDTSKVTDMTGMFNGCTNLTTIPLLDTSKVGYMAWTFQNCSSLSDESLNTILAMCANATSHAGTKTLKYLSLTSAQANKCKSLSNYSAFIAAGWTTGY